MKKNLASVALLSVTLLLSSCASQGESGDAAPGGPASGTDQVAEQGKGTAPISSALAAVQKCMIDEGLEAEYDGRGGLTSGETTDEQSTLWREMYNQCAENHELGAPMSEAQLKDLYALEVENHECLLSAGYESGDPPSEQVYVESWLQNKEFYQSIETVAENQPELFIEATQKCPLPLWSFG